MAAGSRISGKVISQWRSPYPPPRRAIDAEGSDQGWSEPVAKLLNRKERSGALGGCPTICVQNGV
jgi:hypothetical protein